MLESKPATPEEKLADRRKHERVKLKKRAGYTKNKGGGESKARRKMARESRRRNRQ